MLYIFRNNKNQYESVNIILESQLEELLEKYRFNGELYRIVEATCIEIYDNSDFTFKEFRGIFANPELFNFIKYHLELLPKDLHSQYTYHHVYDEDLIKQILKDGLIPQVGELYSSYLESYFDSDCDGEIFNLSTLYQANINLNNLVPGIFLCTDMDYDVGEDDIVVCIETKYLKEIYRDFNETRNDCFFTTYKILPEAIVGIAKFDENGEMIESIYERDL